MARERDLAKSVEHADLEAGCIGNRLCRRDRASQRRAEQRVRLHPRDALGETKHLLFAEIAQSAVKPPLRDAGHVLLGFAMPDENELFDHVVTATAAGTNNDSAVISFGCSIPRIARIVGATFSSAPPPRSDPNFFFGSNRI